MKIKLSIFITITTFILLSCKDSILKTETTKVSINTATTSEDSETLLNELVTQIDSVQNEEPLSLHEQEDCIFDQVTQTDDFLKGIKELETYIWDAETKTAEIVLNDHWSLTIKRGGCDHFEMSANFIYDRILNIEEENDKQQIFDSIIWITSLLEDFDGEDIKRVIEEDKVYVTKRDEYNYHANFMDEKLYELYYFDFNNKDRTTFKIGYYYN